MSYYETLERMQERYPTVAGPWLVFVEGDFTELCAVEDEEVEIPAPEPVLDEQLNVRFAGFPARVEGERIPFER